MANNEQIPINKKTISKLKKVNNALANKGAINEASNRDIPKNAILAPRLYTLC